MNRIGFWKEEPGTAEAVAEVMRLIEPEWSMTREARACVQYMKAGIITESYMGHACNRITGRALGCSDMVSPDGKWAYPELWWDYINNQSVRIENKEFIEDAVRWCIDRFHKTGETWADK